MAGELPPNLGGGPPSEVWGSSVARRSTPRVGSGRTISMTSLALAAIAVVLAGAALVVTLAHSTNATSSTKSSAPAYTAGETAAAQRQLCDTYRLAARSVQVDTNGSDKALARTATINAAVMLEKAAGDPALDSQHRDAARDLAMAYLIATAKATNGVSSEVEWQAAINDIAVKDTTMKMVCGGGS